MTAYPPLCSERKQQAISFLGPIVLIPSIPHGQYCRIKQNCLNPQDFEREASALRDCLLLQRYSKKCLKKAYHQKACGCPRSELPVKRKKTEDSSGDTLKLVTTYSYPHYEIREAISKFLCLLSMDEMVGN